MIKYNAIKPYGREVLLHALLLISALAIGEGQIHAAVAYARDMSSRYLSNRKLGGPQNRSGRFREGKNSCLCLVSIQTDLGGYCRITSPKAPSFFMTNFCGSLTNLSHIIAAAT